MTFVDLQSQRLAMGDPDAIVRDALEKRIKMLKDALENLVIAVGMGWYLKGVLDVACAALEKSDG